MVSEMTKRQSKKGKTDLDIVVEFNAFEDYFNSVWIGTPECGGRVPSSRDADYDEYIRLRIIALGAWMHRARYTPPGYLK